VVLVPLEVVAASTDNLVVDTASTAASTVIAAGTNWNLVIGFTVAIDSASA